MQIATIQRESDRERADIPMRAIRDHAGAGGKRVWAGDRFFAASSRAQHLVEIGVAEMDWQDEEGDAMPVATLDKAPAADEPEPVAPQVSPKLDKRSKAYRRAAGRSR